MAEEKVPVIKEGTAQEEMWPAEAEKAKEAGGARRAETAQVAEEGEMTAGGGVAKKLEEAGAAEGEMPAGAETTAGAERAAGGERAVDSPLYMPHMLPPGVELPAIQVVAKMPGETYSPAGQGYVPMGHPVPPAGAGLPGWPQPGDAYPLQQGQPVMGYRYPQPEQPVTGYGGMNGAVGSYPAMGAPMAYPAAYSAYQKPADVLRNPGDKKRGTRRQVAAGVVFLIVGGLGAVAFLAFFGIALWQVLSEERMSSAEVLLPFFLCVVYFALPMVAGMRCIRGKGKVWALAALVPILLALAGVVFLTVSEGPDWGAYIVLMLVGVPFAGVVAGTLLRWIPERKPPAGL